MIKSIQHKGLRRLYEKNDRSGLPPEQLAKIIRILAVLDQAVSPEDLNQPGFKNHPMKQDRAGTWSVWSSGNFRITYRMEDGNAYDIDLEDYH